MSRSSRRGVIVAVILGLATAACGGLGDGPAWAEEAELFAEANLRLLEEQGPIGTLPFFAENLIYDERASANFTTYYESLDEAVLLARFFRLRPGDFSFTPDYPIFVQRTGYALAGVGSLDLLGLGLDTAFAGYVVLYGSIGPRGIEHYMVLPLTTGWRAEPWRKAALADEAEVVAARWQRIWSDAAPDGLRTLYSPNADFRDSLAGLDLHGVEAIATRGALRPAPTWTNATIEGAAAVHLHTTTGEDLSGLAFVTQGDRGDECPGNQLIWLTIDNAGLILEEQRLWSVKDARRCLAERAPDGWWTGRPIPAPAQGPYEDLESVTATIDTAAGTTQIINGTPTLESLFSWAVARFDRAGLQAPDVATVTFTKFTEYCGDVQARAMPQIVEGATVGWSTVFCLGEDDVCRQPSCEVFALRAKRALLHELAHVWMAQNLSDQIREAFVDFRDVESWADRALDWSAQGREQAAEFIAWGLLDKPFGLFELGRPPLDTRHLGFQLLTGRQPLQPEA